MKCSQCNNHVPEDGKPCSVCGQLSATPQSPDVAHSGTGAPSARIWARAPFSRAPVPSRNREIAAVSLAFLVFAGVSVLGCVGLFALATVLAVIGVWPSGLSWFPVAFWLLLVGILFLSYRLARTVERFVRGPVA